MADTGVTAPGLGEEKSLAKLKIQAGSSIFNAQNYSDTPDPSVPVSLKNTSTTERKNNMHYNIQLVRIKWMACQSHLMEYS